MAVIVDHQEATDQEIVSSALNARTLRDAKLLYENIVKRIGERFERPIADRTSNHGLLTSQGSYDYKLLELITNGQDAVLELNARRQSRASNSVPFQTPREAASRLLGHLRPDEQAVLVRTDIYESEVPARRSKLVTPVVRDFGCGLSPTDVPKTVFFLGSDHKDALLYLQGAFGMGGALTYRNAQAVVLISRRHPDLLASGEEDRISVAVCLWQQHQKGRGLFYPVTSPWPAEIDAEPWSCPAVLYLDFEPGTQITLIDYTTEGFHTGRNDRRSFEFMINTRLWNPVFPIRFHNHVATGDHEKTARGLSQRFEDNKRSDRKDGHDVLAFRFSGKTYHLPVSFFYFERGQAADEGGMRNFVYGDHALMFVSNGQCHKHWTPQEFRYRVERLSKLYDRLLVIVETDPLPIDLRTTLFTPDRSGFVNEPDARRLEDAVIGLLNDWDELRDYNNQVAVKSLERRDERPTLTIARKIARELKLRGFRMQRHGGRPKPNRIADADLWPDPTALEGPDELTLVAGETRFVRYHLNATDEFFENRRGRLELECDHPRIGSRELAVGPLRGGMIRVSLVVPDDIDPGQAKLVAHVRDWERAAGGIGAAHRWVTKLTILNEEPERKPRREKRDGDHKENTPDEGPLVAVVRRGNEDGSDEWHSGNPGDVEQWSAQSLAARFPEYGELGHLGDVDIPTVVLNMDYSPLKNYLRTRLDGNGVRDLTTAGVDRAKDRYAVGVGLGLLLHEQERARLRKAGQSLNVESDLHQRQAIARSVLVMMPEYDALLEQLTD